MATYTQDNRQLKLITPLGKDELLLTGFTGQESVSRLFSFHLRLLSENRSVKLEDLVGKKATIKMTLPDGKERLFNGIVNSFSQGGSTMMEGGTSPKIFAQYTATLVPWLWLLTRSSDCRIFQEMTVPEILEQVFKDHKFTDYKIRLQGSFAKREYCVQYRETAFNFVSRLMEEEGIFYFFEHTEDKHTLILANSSNEFKECPLQKSVNYKSIVGLDREDDVITDFVMSREVRPGAYTITDFNYEKPTLDLTSHLAGKGEKGFELYDFPGEFRTKDEGERLVGLRVQEEDTPQVVINGSSTCRGIVPGYRFELQDHYRRDFNKSYVLTSIYHAADQAEAYRSNDENAGMEYYNTFQCVVHSAPYRPARQTPVPLMHGTQTAIVVGPPGAEIYTDKYGRVKVQFHWDRVGKYDDKSSCWIRVSSTWAGKGWGQISLPRIGQEVVVDFMEGNPDDPIIVGRVYNAESMPPYKLPDEQTKSTIKTNSSKGGGGFNELRFEDKKGGEQIFIHAEKDTDFRVKNDQREWIGRDSHEIIKRDKRKLLDRDEHLIIKRDQIEEIQRDHHLKIKGKEAIDVSGARSVKIGGNLAEEVGGNYGQSVTGSVYVKGNMVVIEGSAGITLKCGGNFITVSPAGVMIQGTLVLINSGGAALAGVPGVLVPPMPPQEAEIADNADPGSKEPTFKKQREQQSPAEQAAANAASHNPNSEENKDKTHWVEIEMVNEDGKPVPGVRYRVTLPDGQTLAEGTTDEKGAARVENIDPGNCKVTFPDLDKEAWSKS